MAWPAPSVGAGQYRGEEGGVCPNGLGQAKTSYYAGVHKVYTIQQRSDTVKLFRCVRDACAPYDLCWLCICHVHNRDST